MKTVGEVSALVGITVRTLHHYDEWGLLSPGGRTDSGYRLYSERDLERLQEILGWRALGFSLDEISELLDEVGHDQVSALRTQRELVDAELARLVVLARALDRAIATIEHGDEQQEDTMFDGFDPSQYEDEARERWGHTDAYTEAARRVASYGEAEWREIKAQAQEIERLFAGLKRSGQPADGEPAICSRGAGSSAYRPLALSLLARDAPGARRDVRRRPAICGELREGRAGASRLCSRRDRSERSECSGARVGKRSAATAARPVADPRHGGPERRTRGRIWVWVLHRR